MLEDVYVSTDLIRRSGRRIHEEVRLVTVLAFAFTLAISIAQMLQEASLGLSNLLVVGRRQPRAAILGSHAGLGGLKLDVGAGGDTHEDLFQRSGNRSIGAESQHYKSTSC